MDEITKTHVGLDVHAKAIAIGVAEPGRNAARVIGTIAHDVKTLLKTLTRIGPASTLHIVYEAGPTGFGLQRELALKGYCCEVIAPSKIPRRAADRIKTDRRDCMLLAECSRAGQLHVVTVPDVAHEAIRDLSRAREDAVNSRTQQRHQLKGFLLRHGLQYPGKTSWTRTFYRWLGTLNFGPAPAQTAFTEYWQAVQNADERVKRLTLALVQSIQGWQHEPVVRALQGLRGVDAVTAIGLVAEIGDIGRFEHPRKLMGYLGLVPSEHSSGERVARGSITKTGNSHARRLLVEAAWHYRFKARIGRQAQQRQEGLGEGLRGLAWKAQLRLCGRFAKLDARGVQRNKVCVAVARELAGFVWAIAAAVQRPQTAGS